MAMSSECAILVRLVPACMVSVSLENHACCGAFVGPASGVCIWHLLSACMCASRFVTVLGLFVTCSNAIPPEFALMLTCSKCVDAILLLLIFRG